jgi:hypothetical protein
MEFDTCISLWEVRVFGLGAKRSYPSGLQRRGLPWILAAPDGKDCESSRRFNIISELQWFAFRRHYLL